MRTFFLGMSLELLTSSSQFFFFLISGGIHTQGVSLLIWNLSYMDSMSSQTVSASETLTSVTCDLFTFTKVR